MRVTPALCVLFSAALLTACNDNTNRSYQPTQTTNKPQTQPVTPPVTPQESAATPIKIGVVSDVHIFDAVRLGGVAGQPAYEAALAKDRKALLQSQALLEAALDKLVAAGNQLILVTGDLTKDGEQFSHENFRAAMAKLQSKGVKVLVVPGNHDMNNPYAQHGSIYFEQNSMGADVGSLAPFMEHVSGAKSHDVANFDEFYADFGFKGALARDKNSFSYVTEPVPGLWVMALDIANTSLLDAPAK
ncbi:MAG: metallophosphoesterase family protein, partial [Aeromonadaceae bacterium]